MFTTYKTVSGDTFESISRKKYGTENEAGHIAKANPGVVEPLTPGIDIAVPPVPDAPQDAEQQAPSSGLEEVSLLIENVRFRFWDSVRITRSIDKFDTVEFGAPFDSTAEGFKDTFKPFSFKKIVATVGGDPLFTGTMINISPILENKAKKISVNCYSLPGVLNDCTSPASAYPLEFNGQGLQEIATTIARPFGVGVEFRNDQGSIFDRVASSPGKKIFNFLSELSKQRNLIISSTPSGKLLFWREIETGTPVARLQQGQSPVVSVVPNFNPQAYYSNITGLEPVVVGLPGSQYTVRNKHLKGVLRPLSFSTPDTIDSDVKEVVGAKMGRMFANMASYNLNVDTWRDSKRKLWQPNTTLTLVAPDAMIYSEYEFLIRSVEFTRDRASESAVIKLVIPGSFRGVVPGVLPWEG